MDIFEEIVRFRERGVRAALATVVQAQGSTPGAVASRMLVPEEGAGPVLGTVGGGCLDAEVLALARKTLSDEECRTFHYDLSGPEAEESGLACGGRVTVFVECVTLPRGVVFGAGHVGQMLCRAAAMAGFRVMVLDDREAFANRHRFPEASEIQVRPLSGPFEDLGVNASTFLLLATRGHKHDRDILRWAAVQPAAYVGMLGSGAKRKALFEELSHEGVSGEALSRVRTPMGLDIGARSPGEIALAVVAEMIAVRRKAPRQERAFAVNRKAEEARSIVIGLSVASRGGKT